jgi:hypothetical protein
MNGRIVVVVLLVLVLVAGAVGVGYYAYSAGVAQGILDSGKVIAPAVGAPIAPYYGPLYFGRPFGWGFGFLGCLFPLFFFLLFFGLLRGLFWRRHWGGYGRHGDWGRAVPPMFEEWHRRAHEPQSQPTENK